MRDDQLARRSTEPLPLADYYDEVLLLPDLDRCVHTLPVGGKAVD